MGIWIRLFAIFAAILGTMFLMGAAQAKKPVCGPGYERVEHEHSSGVIIVTCKPLPQKTCEWRNLPGGGREFVCYRLRPVAPKRVKASELAPAYKRPAVKKSADELLAELAQDEVKPPKKRVLTPEQQLLFQIVSR